MVSTMMLVMLLDCKCPWGSAEAEGVATLVEEDVVLVGGVVLNET